MKRLTTEQFIERSKKLHGNKYDYSLVNYKNRRSKIKIICPLHGEFEQTGDCHLSGRGCDKCGGTYTKTTNEFIQKAKKIHGDKYDYSLVNYKNNSTKIKIICPLHGIFLQSPSNHTNHSSGCQKCNTIQKSKNLSSSIKEFIPKAKNIHGDKYNYSQSNYKTAHIKITIICPKHGKFKQKPYLHLNGSGCPTCNESKGEREIKLFLKENNIKFTPQKRFDNCRNKYTLPFDFYLPEYNTCIEYNGIQHYKVFDYFGGIKKFDENKNNFNIKINYCKNNKIKLLIIKYDENIKDSLKSLTKDNT